MRDMTPKEYRAFLARFQLSQKRGGQLLGAAERTSQSWALGGRRVQKATAMLVRAVMRGKITLADLDDLKK